MNDICQESKDWDDSYRGYPAKFPVMDLDHRLRRVEKIIPTQAQLDKYPSLREAYEEFLIIQRLTVGYEEP